MILLIIITTLFIFSEEADDDDDPEYNFVDDHDKPDKEDYRTDRAVQITSKICFFFLIELLFRCGF